MTNKLQNTAFHKLAIDLLHSAKHQVLQQVNLVMVDTYFEIGRIIIEEEQEGKDRADYGKQILLGLSKSLTKEFGRGFSVDNLENMRRFYLVYGKSETLSRISEKSISETLSRKSLDDKEQALSTHFKLSWSHYLTLVRIDNAEERKFYEIESVTNKFLLVNTKPFYQAKKN